MKPVKPELQNTRVVRLARQFVLLPFVLAAALYRWVKALPQRFKSDKELRADEVTRQSRVRRGLRGLPPDHVQEATKPG
jgi:hypothetical protein